MSKRPEFSAQDKGNRKGPPLKLLIGLFLLSGNAMGQSFKKEAKQTALRIASNAKTASVAKDGILAGEVTASNFLLIEAQQGWNDLTISGSGFVTRNIKTFISVVGTSDLYIETSAKLSPPLPMPQSIPEIKIFTPLSKAPSYCEALKKMTPSSQVSKITCLGKTVADEVNTIGLGFTKDIEPSEALTKQTLLEFKRLMSGPWQPGWQLKSEELHTAMATIPLGMEAVMISSLLSNDCSRVLEMAKEGVGQGVFSPNMYFMTGICLELAGNSKDAVALYNPVLESVKTATDTSASIGNLYWHKATIQLVETPLEAIKTLEACIKANPWYRPCSRLLVNLYTSQGFLKKSIDVNRKIAQEMDKRMAPLADKMLFALSKKDFTKVDSALKALPRLSETFELTWIGLLSKNAQTKELGPEDLGGAAYAYISSEKTALKILTLVEKTLHKEWIEAAYKSFVKDFPGNGYYWWKLGNLYLEDNRCRDVIELLTPIDLQRKDQQAALTELLGRCYIANKDYTLGIKTLKKMTQLAPMDWKSHYQLGEAFTKALREKEAKGSYLEALQLNPPDKFKKMIEKKAREIP